MATSPPVVQASSVADPVKLPVLSLLIAFVLGVVVATLGVGGIVYFLVRSGRLPIQSGAAAKAELKVPATTHAMVLEPLLVNLADSGGNAYVRVGLTLRVADAASEGKGKNKEDKGPDSKNSKDADAAVRDTALMVLGRQTSESLLDVDGKERLKAELKAAIAEHNSELKVMDLFFTEFLVQR
jgi:flagellar protein FliL